MNLNPARVLTKPVSIKSAIVLVLLVIYVTATFIIFFQLVVPSFEHNTTSVDFAVDSTIYVYFADTIRQGIFDPWVMGALTQFPNTAWMPVLMSLVLKSNFLIMLANYAMVVTSIVLLKKTYNLSLTTFLPLLLMNATTMTSILCVNKEVVDLLALSIFLFVRAKRLHWLLPFVLVFSFLNRWETCMVFTFFMFADSRLNPLRYRRWATVFMLVLVINFAMPFWQGRMLARRFDEISAGNTVVLLGKLQLNYMFIIAVIPKIADNLFGQLLNHQVWELGGSWLIINLLDNLAYAIMTAIVFAKRLFSLRNDLIYFAVIGSIIAAQSLAIQPRYFYFVYVLLCLQVALKKPLLAAESFSLQSSHSKLVHARDRSSGLQIPLNHPSL